MSLHLFSTLTKKKEAFTPITKGKALMYTCGPTVYGRPHIGNYASFLMADLLRRWLEVIGFSVAHVKNITDVGHLVADSSADAGGEDKIEKVAKRDKAVSCELGAVSMEDVIGVARRYEEEYLADEEALHMVEPEARPRATETIKEMISIIQTLLKSGHAYEAPDAIYYSVEAFEGYGKLSGNTLANLSKLEKGVRIEVKDTKKHPADFALWKKCVGENAEHVLRWSFPEGKQVSGGGEDPGAGFPGWHIECSAMSVRLLSETVQWSEKNAKFEMRNSKDALIDIHTGGEDNIFPHHECEIAQSEAAFGHPFVKYWLHKRRVNFANEKMSKSLGNVLSLSDIEERGFSALDLRFFFLSSHYRSHTNFSWKGLEDARKARLRVSEWVGEVGGTAVLDVRKESEESEESEEFTQRFTQAMNDDLNTPEALAVVFEVMAWSRQQDNKTTGQQDNSLRDFCEMLEQTFGCFASESFEVPDEVTKLAEEREEARRAGDYARSDELRDAVKERGFVIEDLPEGPRVVPQNRRR